MKVPVQIFEEKDMIIVAGMGCGFYSGGMTCQILTNQSDSKCKHCVELLDDDHVECKF